MIVPDHWAEARKQHRSGGRQVTVHRFGWSNDSVADAQAMAEQRVDEALQRILSGEPLSRHEPKTAYNGAFGVPIREEVLARHGEEVITRNSYGAHCLNTPHALFADIDFNPKATFRAGFLLFALLATACVLAGLLTGRWGIVAGALFLSAVPSSPMSDLFHRLFVAGRGGPLHVAKKRLDDFLSSNPSWNLRLYRTPGGLRVLATHQPFDALGPEVRAFFSAVDVDPVYVRMCLNQRCFRARLTAKPWRIGVGGHMRPRPGVWPVRPEKRALREQWVAGYERAASGYAACHFLESIGSGIVHPRIDEVRALHDRESRALDAALPIA